MPGRTIAISGTCCICGASMSCRRIDRNTCGPACKKALQRAIKRLGEDFTGWTARDVTDGQHLRQLLGGRGLDLPSKPKKGDKLTYKQGQLVEFCHGPNTPWIPGRINWLSYVGEQIRHAVLPAGSLPVEDLMGVRAKNPDFVRPSR